MGVVENGTQSSNIQAFMNSLKSFIGVGVLSMPYALKQSGLLAGNLMMVLIAVGSWYTMGLLIRTKNEVLRQKAIQDSLKFGNVKTNYIDEDAPLLEKRDMNFGEVGRFVLGRPGLWIVNFAVTSSQLGVCCAYVIFISDTMNSMLPQLGVNYYALILFPIVTLLAWIRNIRLLAPTSIFANFALLLAISVVFYFGFSNFEKRDDYPLFRPGGFPSFFGLAVFAFEGINLAIPIESSMREPTKYKRVLSLSVLVVGLIYTLFGTLGYLFFGDSVEAEITLNLPDKSVIVYIVKSCLVAELIFSYPVQFFPITIIVEPNFFPNKNIKFIEIKKNILRTVLVAISVLVALYIPYFALFTALIGAFSNSIVGFILPPILIMKTFRGSLKKWEIALNVFILICGLAASGISSTTALIQIIDALKS